MRPDIIFGSLLAVFLVVQIVRRLRGRRDDFSDDGTLDRSSDPEDLDDDA